MCLSQSTLALIVLSSVAFSQVPANDNCVGAPFVSEGLTPFDSSFATTDGQALDPVVCDMGFPGDEQLYQDVWFVFAPTVSGSYSIAITNSGQCTGFTSYDSRLAVYDNPFCPDDPALIIACDDNSGPANQAWICGVFMTAGSQYLIRAGSFDAATIAQPAGLWIGAACPETYANHCEGDGGDQLGCTNCPCGNNAPIGTIGGCLNSLGSSARLVATGSSSTSLPAGSLTDLRFAVCGAIPNVTCVLKSGDALAPLNPANPCFGLGSGVQSAVFDGLRCAVMNAKNVGARTSDSFGNVGFGTSPPWGGAAGPNIGIAAQGGFTAGHTRYFQVIYRDDPMLVCQTGLNTTQAVEVTFTL